MLCTPTATGSGVTATLARTGRDERGVHGMACHADLFSLPVCCMVCPDVSAHSASIPSVARNCLFFFFLLLAWLLLRSLLFFSRGASASVTANIQRVETESGREGAARGTEGSARRGQEVTPDALPTGHSSTAAACEEAGPDRTATTRGFYYSLHLL
jgi:hypothetical protein